MKRENLLLVADSERDADMLYATGVFAPDPFIFFQIDGRRHVVVNDLEIDRFRRRSGDCRVLSLSHYSRKLQRSGRPHPTLAHIIRAVLREHRLKKVLVPESFPFGLARTLRRLKVKLKLRPGFFFPERQLKTAEEIKKISAALIMAEVGLAEAVQTLKQSKIAKDGRLVFHNAYLTSEKLRSIIDTAVLQAGGCAVHTIVAGGRQACDPHESGHGRLRANEPIILDVFPRSQKTGYYGDITRTVVRGRATESVRRLYHTVVRAQELAFSRIEAGTPARDLHQSVQDFFDQEGYRTGHKNGRMVGFFHGTGHGLGLDLHEAPSLGARSQDVLQAGHVVTVEPGLYYPGTGGVRLEDVALVTSNSARNLTEFEKVLEV